MSNFVNENAGGLLAANARRAALSMNLPQDSESIKKKIRENFKNRVKLPSSMIPKLAVATITKILESGKYPLKLKSIVNEIAKGFVATEKQIKSAKAVGCCDV